MKPEQGGQSGKYPLPDLALLRVQSDSAAGHPAVLLGSAEPGEYLIAEGYTRGVNGRGYVPDSARLKFEALRPESECLVIKTKDSILDDGLSGGPLLDEAAGRVVGMIKAQRSGWIPLGGVAVSLTIIRDRFPELWAANSDFHQSDRRWEFARLSDSSTEKPVEATYRCLQLVREIVNCRPKIVPPGVETYSVQQIPSVRAERGRGQAWLKSSNTAGEGDRSSPTGDAHENGVFRWPLVRARWPTVVLSGMPGVGKSYLLNMHAEALAQNVQERLADGGVDSLTMPIPVLVDCATLGHELPDRASGQQVIQALIDSLQVEAEAVQDGILYEKSVAAVIQLAYMDGRLVTCLDALDEAGPRERARVLKALTYLAEGKNRVVLTSRPQPSLRDDTAALANCFRAEVVGFSAGQVFAFARAWFAEEHGLAGRFEAELRERPELQALARVPLLAAFLCQLASEQGDVRALPTSAVMLYQAVVKAALSGRWKVDPTRRAIDRDNPPDPELRLRLLSDALGALTCNWRSRIDRFSMSALDEQLLAHPGYNRALTEATARLASWQALQPNGGVALPHSSPVRWEYLFDGLLTHDVSDSDAMVRFAHPVLGEYCIAEYIAGLDDEQLEVIVAEHRWFDASWEQIWPLSAALMSEPERLIRLFLSVTRDGWHEQLFLASRCVVGAAGRVSSELASQIVTRVCEIARDWRPFDRDRALVQLNRLVHAGIPGAVAAARELIDDTAMTSRTRMRIAAILAEAGDQTGLTHARLSLADRAIPAGYREWLARAVVVVGDHKGMEQLKVAIKGARIVGELLRLVAAIPVETKPGGELVTQVLRDQTAPVVVRSAAGRALIRIGDAQKIAIARQLAIDPVTVWLLRAALIAELLAIGEEGLIEDGITVLSDPSISGSIAVDLVENLIRRGEARAFPAAMRYLSSRTVNWQERRRLAEAIAELGSEGVLALRAMVDSSLAVDLKLRALVALNEVGEARDVAKRIVSDTGEPAWIRARLACSLVQAGDTAVDEDVLTALVTDPEPGHDFQSELIVAMTARYYPQASSAALDLLKRNAKKYKNSYVGNSNLMAALATAGQDGRDLLCAVANDMDTAEEDRALAIISLADTDPVQAGALAVEMLDKFSTFVRSRLAIILAEKGSIEISDEVTTLLDKDPEAYTALFKLLDGPRTPRSLIDKLLKFGMEWTQHITDRRETLKLDDEFIAGCGLTWSSDSEKEIIANWIYNRLEFAVGAKISSFLTSSQVYEFEELSSDEERVEFLASNASGYSEVVREQARLIREELSSDHNLLPDFHHNNSVPLMARLSHCAAVIAEWARITVQEGQSACADFLIANESIIASREGIALLQLGQELDDSYNPHEGLYYIASIAAENIGKGVRFVRDSTHRHTVYHDLLANNAGGALLLAGLAGTLLEPVSASSSFYAALGAAITDRNDLAIFLMKNSSQCAGDEQRAQGLNTIRREGIRLGWEEKTTDALLAALSGQDGEDAGPHMNSTGDDQ